MEINLEISRKRFWEMYIESTETRRKNLLAGLKKHRFDDMEQR